MNEKLETQSILMFSLILLMIPLVFYLSSIQKHCEKPATVETTREVQQCVDSGGFYCHKYETRLETTDNAVYITVFGKNKKCPIGYIEN